MIEVAYRGYLLYADWGLDSCFLRRVPDGALLIDTLASEVAMTERGCITWLKAKVDRIEADND